MIEWMFDQKHNVTLVAAIMLFVVTLVMRYGFDIWWPWGIAMATILGVYSLFNGVSDR